MRKLIGFVLIIAALAACKKNNDNPSNPATNNMDSVTMGQGYANDIYYSLSDGVVKTESRTDWDLAFSIPLRTAGIRINEGAGVKLYSYGPANGWGQDFDTTGISHWTAQYNDKANWLNGAFNRNTNTSNIFNYGWGTYDAQKYNVYADSTYIIVLPDGSYKKFYVKKKNGYTDSYVFSWANLDGSNMEQDSVVGANYGNKNFIYYSLTNKMTVDHEPDKGTWDLLFTQYIEKVPSGPGMYLEYPVMGVLTNDSIQTAMVPKAADQADYNTATFKSDQQCDRLGLESDDPVTHTYSLVTDTTYFVKQTDGSVYQLNFTGFGGSATGKVVFEKKKVN